MALPKMTTPTYELEIPSTDEKIKYRPFLVKEEKILMMAMESKSDSDITAYDTLQSSNEIREERDKRLKLYIDTLNPIRWNALSSTKQTEWATYRQALLDIPDQAGFPNSVTWPTKPT